MRGIRTGLMLLFPFALLACSPAAPPEGPAPMDPSGRYDFVATMGDETHTGLLTIERTAAGLDAEAWVDTEPEPALGDSVVVSGSSVVVHMRAGDQPVTFDLEFEGTGFSGDIRIGGRDPMTVPVTGTRRAE